MASHQLAIAKASFSAGLLRPDPTSVSRDSIADFHTLLNTVVVQCSPRNVQKCKQWILENITQSATRFTALGKYLTALTTSFSESGRRTESKTPEPSIKRKRLHVLYLVNDVLFHTRHRVNDASICGKIQPILVSLFGSAASFKDCPKHERKIVDLLGIWEEKGYYSKDYVEKLREAVKNASEAGEHVEGSTGNREQGLPAKSSKLTPYVMPALHGDASTPWFELPAGNLMPHIVPNSTRPINPDMIKPLQFLAGPAEETLTSAVKALLDDVQAIFGDVDMEEKPTSDIDELGQSIVVDEITGDILEGEGYYGWSRTFCEKMKRRKQGLDVSSREEGREQRSRSRSSSPGTRKRRYSQSDSGSDRGDYKSRHRPDGNGNAQRSRSRSFSRSPPPPDARPSNGPPAVQRSPPPPHPNLPIKLPMPPFSQPPFQPGFNPNFPPPPPPNMPFNGQPQFGAWPPPPPPMQNMNYNPQEYPQSGSWPPPPPLGPPPGNPLGIYQQINSQQQANYQQQGGYAPSVPGGWQQQQQQGRGYNSSSSSNNNNNNRWNTNPRGRAGYRGRGW